MRLCRQQFGGLRVPSSPAFLRMFRPRRGPLVLQLRQVVQHLDDLSGGCFIVYILDMVCI